MGQKQFFLEKSKWVWLVVILNRMIGNSFMYYFLSILALIWFFSICFFMGKLSYCEKVHYK